MKESDQNQGVFRSAFFKSIEPFRGSESFIDVNYYLLDYGEDDDCHFNITLNKEGNAVKGVTIFRPCRSSDMEQSVYKLISQFPMFMTYPTTPVLLVTANSKCVQIIIDENPELLEDLTVVDSFESYLKTALLHKPSIKSLFSNIISK